ncbi:MAG: AraC family transcriptional regulator [Gammaproteobacteria bacterium]|nr:MAG: AraC family transcriptional regulator [Gammaproteobacteria bacterium]RLA51754.1 MAG: AraC family transcriptional regulator [Gammaproteobacteria bacterium]
MNNATKQQQKLRINEALYAIHRDLSHPWTAESLAKSAAYSTHHFHRIFKAVTGENLNTYIRRTRLERAANMLIFHGDMSATEIAQRCGFVSPSNFTHRFKEWFGETPTAWRDGGYRHFEDQIAQQHQDDELSDQLDNAASKELPPVSMVRRAPMRVAYIRHKGYDRSISRAWQRLQEWAEEEGIAWAGVEMTGLYHSNPNIVPLPECRYVACITVPDTVWRQRDIGIMTIPGGLHAQVHVEGRYGELLPILHRLLYEWLPHSGYKMALTPVFACYQRNQFLSADESFELDLYLPVKTV